MYELVGDYCLIAGDDALEEMFYRVVNELAEKDGITEALKAEDQLLGVQRMNGIRQTAAEIGNNELIYA